MKQGWLCLLAALFVIGADLAAQQPVHIVVDPSKTEAVSVSFRENQHVIIDIEGDARFLRGLEAELTAPQGVFSQHNFSAAFSSEAKENRAVAAWEGKPLYSEILADKITTVYQIPVRPNAGFRRTPYVTVMPEYVVESSFPLLFSVGSVSASSAAQKPQGAQQIEDTLFRISVKPVLSDEGALKLTLRYPLSLRDKPVSVLVDDEVLADISVPRLLREGEHHLLVLSEDYRTESRHFFVERGKTAEISVTLKDTMPTLLFEAPDRALIFINNRRVFDTGAPYLVSPGVYDVKIQVSDYTIIKTVQVQKGKTYRIAFTVDMSVSETD